MWRVIFSVVIAKRVVFAKQNHSFVQASTHSPRGIFDVSCIKTDLEKIEKYPSELVQNASARIMNLKIS